MKVLLTGDSIIARQEGKNEPHLNWNLHQLLPQLKIYNTAVSGINSGAFFACLDRLVFQVPQCDNLVILLGTNDLPTHKQVPLKQFKQNMRLISSAIICRYYPPHVILISPPAVDEQKQWVRNNQLVAAYTQAVQQSATEYHFHFINLFQAMLATHDLPHISRGIKNDGLHFGDQGYALLGRLLANELKRM